MQIDKEEKPTKKFYDPRMWIRAAELSMISRAKEVFGAVGKVLNHFF
jgi:fructose-bisphosphate aldolase class II